MGAKQIVILSGFVLLLSGGQLLFKRAAVSVPAIDRFDALFALARNPWLWAALILCGAAAALWIVILQKTPLSMAYPFIALCFVVVPLAANVFFQESYSLKTLLGSALILAGVTVSILR